jgi:glycosyltransferase involved in cell wall biosynthesis
MVSVIIPAHNEERYLGETLEALNRQNYGWFEVIVVANGCTDGTAELARGNCQRLIVLSQKSLGVARNLGARMARGDLLVFLDADTLLEPLALRIIAGQFTRSHAAATLKGRPDVEYFKYKLIYFLKNFTHLTRLHRGSSGVIVCWKKHFIDTRGFDEGLEVRENSELIRRLRRYGSYAYIADAAATTSMRRYARRGCGRMFWLWCKLWAQSWFGDLHRRPYESVR